jgi:cytochrome c biogenesis protein CcmG/thiol:disulfide interchange protein DsbE
LNKIKPFVKENGMNYPILFVEPENIQSLVDSYGGIRGIPTTFLIDKNGIIRHKWVGPRSEEVFMEEINKYM